MNAHRAAFEPPPPRTRPSNRRELIGIAARELFFERGYESISMGDIAGAVGIGPSALYRHFRGKQELLYAVLSEAIVPIADQLRELDGSDPRAWVPDFVAVAIDHGQAGLLWQREQVHLPDAQRVELRDKVRAVGLMVADTVQQSRPELTRPQTEFIAWGALAVALSPGFYRQRQTDDFKPEVVVDLVSAVVTGPAPVACASSTVPARTLVPQSRREALLMAATRLFGRQGYSNVGIEDIGAAVGMAGPSVYNHFATKADILVAALERGWAYLMLDLDDVFSTASDESAAVRGLLRSYVGLSVRHPEIATLLITEARHLPAERQETLRLAQREYLSEWTALVSASSGGDASAHARTKVGATIRLVNDLVRVPHLRRIFDIEASIEALGARLLIAG